MGIIGQDVVITGHINTLENEDLPVQHVGRLIIPDYSSVHRDLGYHHLPGSYGSYTGIYFDSYEVLFDRAHEQTDSTESNLVDFLPLILTYFLFFIAGYILCSLRRNWLESKIHKK